MNSGTILKQELPSVFAADLRTMLNEAKRERDLRSCADKLNSHQFEQLPHDEQVELATLYADRLFHITGALLG